MKSTPTHADLPAAPAAPVAPAQADLSDDELIGRLNAGDVEAALAELRGRYGKRIFGLVIGIVRDSHLAEDVLSEVFAKVFFKSHLYRPGSNFGAWLCEVARNQALSALRVRRQVPRSVTELLNGRGEADDVELLENASQSYEERTAEEHELMRKFQSAVEMLPPAYRDVFRMCVQEGMQYREAAAALDLPTGTVAIRIMRARRRLFESLSPHLDRLRRPPACFVN